MKSAYKELCKIGRNRKDDHNPEFAVGMVTCVFTESGINLSYMGCDTIAHNDFDIEYWLRNYTDICWDEFMDDIMQTAIMGGVR